MNMPNQNRSVQSMLFSAALAAAMASSVFAQLPTPAPAPAPVPAQAPVPAPTPATQGAPQTPSAPPVELPTQTVTGTVDGYNRDPRGRINSVVIKSGGRLDQFGLPPDLAAGLSTIAPAGQQVTAVGVPEREVGDRTIYRTTKLTGAGGKEIAVPTPGTPPTPVHVEGTITRLNFAAGGEVDGAMLDNGDYVHTGAPAAATLAVGSKLSADGPAVQLADGNQAIEATTVNGVAVPPPPAREPGPRPRPEDRRPLGGPTPPVPPAPANGPAANPPVPPAATSAPVPPPTPPAVAPPAVAPVGPGR